FNTATVVQSGTQHNASVTQSAAIAEGGTGAFANFNDANILQSGFSQTATIVQTGLGTGAAHNVVNVNQSGSNNTAHATQHGGAAVGADVSAKHFELSLGVGADDRYLISVKLFDGGKLVAEQVLRHPK